MSNEHTRLQELNEQIKLKLAEGNLDEAERLSISLIESAEGAQHPDENPKEAIGSIISKFVSSVIAKGPTKPTEAQIAQIRESAVNDEHVRLLSLFHYVNAALSAAFSLIFLIYIGFGGLMVLNPGSFASQGTAPPPEVGWMFMLFGLIPMVMIIVYAGLNAWAGRCLKQRKHHTICLVLSGINCLNMPFGIILGISTILVISREKVKSTFTTKRRKLQQHAA